MGCFGVLEVFVLNLGPGELLPGVEVLEVVVNEEVEDDGGGLGCGDVFGDLGGGQLAEDLSAFHYYNKDGRDYDI
jgi:hypothetical protein